MKSAHFPQVPQRLWVSYLMSQAPLHLAAQKGGSTAKEPDESG